MSRRMTKQDIKEELPLSKAAEYLIEECRMVLPGIQALWGFQLIAVFNSAFSEKLTAFEQRLHLLAIGLVGVAIVIIMTPAAYHRQTGPQDITQRFIDLATRLMLFSMPPLALSICLDLYLISRLILNNVLVSLLITSLLFILFIILWFVLPHSEAMKQILDGKG
ncbi:MAG TPA: DUF6328 family protein [Anaerolineales bacterium]|nr:DUF6328 family protein [Anaerolineales bacterium]